MSSIEEIARGGDDEEAEGGGEKEPKSYDDVGDSAVADLCNALGVPEDKHDAVKSALGDYVKACVEKALGSEEE